MIREYLKILSVLFKVKNIALVLAGIYNSYVTCAFSSNVSANSNKSCLLLFINF